MKSIAWSIVFAGILFANAFENWSDGRHEYSNPQGIAVLIAIFGFLISLAL